MKDEGGGAGAATPATGELGFILALILLKLRLWSGALAMRESVSGGEKLTREVDVRRSLEGRVRRRNSSRTWLERENALFAAATPAGSLVLDAGAGDQPYRALFTHCTYEAADFELVDKDYARSTYVCDLASIPVEDGRFDAVLFNQVMEHLPDPARVLQELQRVLKPGGRMIATAPLFYEEHEQPYDFFRFTQFAWRKLMSDAGFHIDQLNWMEGYFGTVAYQLETASNYLPKRLPGAFGITVAPFLLASKLTFRLLANLYYRLDERARFTGAGFPKNYVVIAHKV